MLKSSTTTVLESVCAFKSLNACLMKLDALTLGAYRVIIVISIWCISPFISMKCPSLSHLINVHLKSILSDTSIATLACFQGYWLGKFLPAFHLKPMFVSVNKMGFLQTTECWIFLFNIVCQTVSFDGGVESIDVQC
jgi:hypothetical protein